MMNIFKLKNTNIFPYLIATILFIIACILQAFDDFIDNWNMRTIVSITAQYIFLGLLSYWTVSVINRVSDKFIRIGLVTTVSLMSSILLLKLIKYNVVYDNNAERYLWYAYYIPQSLSPAVLFLTILKMGINRNLKISKKWNLILLPAFLLIILVFTNDLHQFVFKFPEGINNGSKYNDWNTGYYIILGWIAGMYLLNGILLFIKCKISHCRKNAWLPLALFIFMLAFCILREIFNPAFIKMPETVVFSVVIVLESLILIGFIPSNTEYAKFFDMADVSAIIVDKNFNIKLQSKNAPNVSYQQLTRAFLDGELSLSDDLTLRGKKITGGEVFWVEDSSVINKINKKLEEINETLSEETDLINAENALKEQRSKLEEQNNLYKEIFNIARGDLETISKLFRDAITKEEKTTALKYAVVYGVFIKRRSNLTLIKKNNIIPLTELIYAFREVCDALTFCDVYSSVFSNVEGDFPSEVIELIFEFFEECIELALPNLSACLVRISSENKNLSCRIALDNVKSIIDVNFKKEICEKLKAKITIDNSDETHYMTITFSSLEDVYD